MMNTAASTLACSPQPARPLERIATAADRAENLAIGLVAFLERAMMATQSGANNAQPPAAPGYVNQIDRLHCALDQIEANLQTLHGLG